MTWEQAREEMRNRACGSASEYEEGEWCCRTRKWLDAIEQELRAKDEELKRLEAAHKAALDRLDESLAAQREMDSNRRAIDTEAVLAVAGEIRDCIEVAKKSPNETGYPDWPWTWFEDWLEKLLGEK